MSYHRILLCQFNQVIMSDHRHGMNSWTCSRAKNLRYYLRKTALIHLVTISSHSSRDNQLSLIKD